MCLYSQMMKSNLFTSMLFKIFAHIFLRRQRATSKTLVVVLLLLSSRAIFGTGNMKNN